MGASGRKPRRLLLVELVPDEPVSHYNLGLLYNLTDRQPEALKQFEIARELDSRRQEGRENAPPIYLFLYNLGRFRDLKKEDDYGFSSGGNKISLSLAAVSLAM